MIESLLQTGKPKAAGIHLVLSVAAVGALAALMLAIWYPRPYFEYDGGLQVMRIIVLVDVVLGPMLTFIVFKRGKQSLKFDLGVIAALQIAAFVYGAGTMYLYRPAFIALFDGNFHTVTWPDLEAHSRSLERPERVAGGAGRPAPAVLRLPQGAKLRAAILAESAAFGVQPIHRGELFDAFTDADWNALFARAVDMQKLRGADPESAEQFDAFTRKHGKTADAVAVIPLNARNGIILLIFDRQSRAVAGWISAEPPQFKAGRRGS